MSEDTSLPFSIGEAVVYPNQGLCNISGIEEKEVAGQKLLFIHLVRQMDGAKVMVPTSKAASVGLRKVAARSEVLAVLEFLKSNSDKASLDWKTRARTNTEHMARGSLMSLAEVVKALQVLSELRPLPSKERELYNNARSMLVEEMAISLGVEPCDAEDSIDAVLFPVGKARPRRTPEEFQMELETPLERDLLALDEDALLEEPEDENSPEITEEGGEEMEELRAIEEVVLPPPGLTAKIKNKNKITPQSHPKTPKRGPSQKRASPKPPSNKTKKTAQTKTQQAKTRPAKTQQAKAAKKTKKAALRPAAKKKTTT
ncbi:MAG: transcriptional regulator [Cystobacterineae bacterium]|nr:transcriptional regulator [Cystobacterineae bacterium]